MTKTKTNKPGATRTELLDRLNEYVSGLYDAELRDLVVDLEGEEEAYMTIDGSPRRPCPKNGERFMLTFIDDMRQIKLYGRRVSAKLERSIKDEQNWSRDTIVIEIEQKQGVAKAHGNLRQYERLGEWAVGDRRAISPSSFGARTWSYMMYDGNAFVCELEVSKP